MEELKMTANIHWRYGDTNPVVAAVDAETLIKLGDLLWQDTDDAKPASMITQTPGGQVLMDLTEQSLQEVFSRKFLGVAMHRSERGQADFIRVAITGVFEFDVLARDCFELGDLIGISPYDATGKISVQNQEVTKVMDSKYAIARVAKRVPDPSTSVLVDIRSQVMGIPV